MASDPYVYPGTSVLINKLGIRDSQALAQAEADIVYVKFQRLLETGVAGELTPAWHKAVHRALFGDLYPFAGKYRSMDIAKFGEAPYASWNFLEANAKQLFQDLPKVQALGKLEAVPFRHELAMIMADVHVLHPFREGNTRTLQVAMFEIALRAGHRLDWQRSDPKAIRVAGTAAAFGNYLPYERILESIGTSPSDERRAFVARALQTMRAAKTTILTSAIEEQPARMGSVMSGRVIAADDRYVAMATGPRTFAVLEQRKLSQDVSVGQRVKARVGANEIAIEGKAQGRGQERSR